MIYIVSNKFFRKHDRKLVKPAEYVIIDGDSPSVTGSTSGYASDEPITTVYNNAVEGASLCPDGRLYDYCRNIAKGEQVNPQKFERLKIEYFDTKHFMFGANLILKGLISGGPYHPKNVFVVLPNCVYKVLGGEIKAFLQKKISKVTDRKVVFTKEFIKETKYNCLSTLCDVETMKSIDDLSKRIESKSKFAFQQGGYDDDD